MRPVRHTVLLLVLCLAVSAPVVSRQAGREAKKKPGTSDLPLKTDGKIEFTTDEGTWISKETR